MSTQPVRRTADAADVPTSIIREIEADHHACAAAQMTVLQRAIDCGNRLRAVRMQLRHGQWGAFIESLSFSSRTARQYMQLADLHANNPSAFVEGVSLRETIARATRELNAGDDLDGIGALGDEHAGDRSDDLELEVATPSVERFLLSLDELRDLTGRAPNVLRAWLAQHEIRPVIDAVPSDH